MRLCSVKLKPIVRLLVFAAFLFVHTGTTVAQNMSFEDFAELIADNFDDEGVSNQEVIEELYELHCNPLNLNTVTEEQLTALPFLTDRQTADIMTYLKKYRPVMSTGELMVIESLNVNVRAMLRLLCYAGKEEEKNVSLKSLLRHSDNEAIVRTDFPLYTKAGFMDYPESVLDKSPNKAYRGNGLYHSLRYRLNSSNRIEAGIQMEKDAGESGVDYLSGYVMLKNTGIFHTFAAGDYRLSFGQGLVMNTSAGFGKNIVSSNIGRNDRGITKHSSTSETGYLRGLATTLKLGALRLSAFFSHKKEDGTMLADSSGVSAIKTDGLHRTPLEHSKKGNMTSTVFGGNARLELSNLTLSATIATTSYSMPLAPKFNTPGSLYRYYNPRGSDFAAYGLAYTYKCRYFIAGGETATSSNGGIATLNTLRLPLGNFQNLVMIQRYYSTRYVSIHGNSFGENSSPQNESGIYIGYDIQINRALKIETYADMMYFPWMKYQVSNSSYGYEGMVQTTYSPRQSLSFSIRYRMKSKQKDFKSNNETLLRYHTTHNLRLQMKCSAANNLTLKTTLAGSAVRKTDSQTALGVLFSENIRWENTPKIKRMELTMTYFNTDDYDSRLYHYEPSLLYTYGFSSYSSHGIRLSFLVSTSVLPNHFNSALYLTAKIGHTKYFNRSSIGSGTEMIDTNHREDLQFQLRWKF